MYRKALSVKLLIVGLLAIAFLIPLMMVRGLIAERAALKDGVVRDVAQSAADRQRIITPVLLIPYTHRWQESVEVQDEAGGKRTTTHQRSVSGAVRLLPDRVALESRPDLSHKYRGLYRVLTYGGVVAIRGHFDIPKDFGFAPKEGRVDWGEPFLAAGVSDPRGIRSTPVLLWNGSRIAMQPGTAGDLSRLGPGVSARLGAADTAGRRVDFSLDLDVVGMERLSVVPTGRENVATIAAAWPHPSFFGRFSPDHTSDREGFSAVWKSTLFATNVEQAYAACAERAKCETFEANEFGVAFIQPADLYQQLERSAKYGFLFVVLTFGAFFLFEALQSLALHPVQYAMVGLALALFFVLLVSLAEHLGFAPAYVLAALACSSLVVTYLAAALASWRRAAGVGLLLCAMYAVLFGLLRSEEHALLAGAFFMFAVLAAVMLGTRRVDWYALGREGDAVAEVST